MKEIGKETPKQNGLVIKIYGIEIARHRHFAPTKNVCTTKNNRLKIIFTSVKMNFAKFAVAKALTHSAPQEGM